MNHDSTLRLGQELVKRKLASLAEIREAIKIREELADGGTETSLGNVLVSRGIIGLEELKVTLSQLGELYLGCPGCEVIVKVKEYDSKNSYLCNVCSGELVYVTKPAGAEERSDSTGSLATKSLRSQRKRVREEENLIGKKVAGYEITGRIASGGMGTVYRATQLNLGRTTALKVLASDLAEDEVFVKRFLLESRAAAELSHPNIIQIYDAGEHSGIFFMSMELIDGENLADCLRREKRLSITRSLEITEQVTSALEHAHSKGIVHRDIKPENIMLTSAGNAKLADLGLAKTLADGSTNITHTGSILGTPHYMAPEQARDFREADHRADIYSLGVTLYRMLSGRVPFQGASPIMIMMKAVDGIKKGVREIRPEVPDAIERLVDRMMAVNAEDRFQTAADLLEAIRERRREVSAVRG